MRTKSKNFGIFVARSLSDVCYFGLLEGKHSSIFEFSQQYNVYLAQKLQQFDLKSSFHAHQV